jgi:hypothetical protein
MGLHAIELLPNDGRKRPFRIEPSGDFQYPGFSKKQREYWRRYLESGYGQDIDPRLPKFCAGRFQGAAKNELDALIREYEKDPPDLPDLDGRIRVPHQTGFLVRIEYSAGSASYGLVFPYWKNRTRIRFENDWQALSERVLTLFEQSGMSDIEWKPDPTRATDLRCR